MRRNIIKYLFLDIDGVLNAWPTFRDSGYRDVPLDSGMISRLNRITDSTGCKIVISSTWRLNPKDDVKKLLETAGVKGEIVGITPNLKIKDRGHEIQAWMTQHQVEAKDIVILDDDSDMVHLKSRLVQSSMADGLTDYLADQAIRLLE